jgi:hypothetical protein
MFCFCCLGRLAETHVTVDEVWSGLEAGFGGDQGCDAAGDPFPDLLLSGVVVAWSPNLSLPSFLARGGCGRSWCEKAATSMFCFCCLGRLEETHVTVDEVWSGLEAGFGGDQGCDAAGGPCHDLLPSGVVVAWSPNLSLPSCLAHGGCGLPWSTAERGHFLYQKLSFWRP